MMITSHHTQQPWNFLKFVFKCLFVLISLFQSNHWNPTIWRFKWGHFWNSAITLFSLLNNLPGEGQTRNLKLSLSDSPIIYINKTAIQEVLNIVLYLSARFYTQISQYLITLYPQSCLQYCDVINVWLNLHSQFNGVVYQFN